MTEIIVIKYNAPEFEKECLDSVSANTKRYRLTVFDNYPANHNLGCLWNRLIALSRCKYICLLNSDTVVEKDWLGKLLKGFKLDPEVRVVGPSTNSCHTKQKEGRGKGTELVDELSGFCLMFAKSHWEEMGGFDETYPFYGQESDFNRRTRQKGYKLAWVKEVFVWHYGSGSAKLAEARGEFDIAQERRKGAQKYHAV